jgi:hypothetical protein
MVTFGKNMDTHRLDTPAFSMWKDEGIIRLTILEPIITLQIARDSMAARKRFDQGIPCPSLVDVRLVQDSTLDARHFMRQPAAFENVTARAYLVQSERLEMTILLQKQVAPPPIPTRFFAAEEEALSWLRLCMDSVPPVREA